MNATEKIKKSNGLDAMIYGKVPPQAIDLEVAILGAILVESSCIPSVVNLIFQEVFYSDSHQRIFKAILNLYDENKSVDILSVLEQLKANEDFDMVGGAYYVTKLTRDVVSSANVEAHCHIVLQKFMSREMIRISGESINDAYDDSNDIFELYDKADNEILNIQEKVLSGAVKDMRFYSEKVYDQYETVKATGILGIQTGIIPIDKLFCGLVPPDLIIIAARPGQGKTALALSLTHHISVMQQVPCAWFSLEMDGIQLTRRLASIDAKISHETIRQGKIAGEEEKRFFNSLDKIGKAPIFIEDKPNINIRSIRTRANILRRKNKIQFIVVDYLQLMQGIDGKNKTRDQIIGEISRGLKCLAKELSIPVIALSQLSREVEKRSDKMPQQSDLRESGSIEADADDIIFLMRPEYYGFTEPVMINKREYDVQGLAIGKGAKNRHGKCENFAMRFNGAFMQFSTHERDVSHAPPPPQLNDYTEPKKNNFDEHAFD